jgi:hypothetical protein
MNEWENSCEEMRQGGEDTKGIEERNYFCVIFEKSCASSDIRGRICKGYYGNVRCYDEMVLGICTGLN